MARDSNFLINSIYTVQGFQQYSNTLNKATGQITTVEKATKILGNQQIQLTKTTKGAKTSITAVNKSMANGVGASNDFINAMKRSSSMPHSSSLSESSIFVIMIQFLPETFALMAFTLNNEKISFFKLSNSSGVNSTSFF